MTHEPHDNSDWSVDNRPKTFDFSDPATWQYWSLDRTAAEYIAKGYPKYWTVEFDLQGVEISQAIAEDLAENHRRETWELVLLKNPTFPVCNYMWYAPALSLLPALTTRGRTTATMKELGTTDLSYPFAVICDVIAGESYKSGKKVIDSTEWHSFAKRLSKGLTHKDAISLHDEFLPQIGRHGKRLADGALYKGGSRQADQQMLELLSGDSKSQAVRWGPLRYKTQTVFDSHFCVVGKPRTGKTTILKLLFQSIHTDLKEKTRFIFYDAKPDLLPCMTRPEDLDEMAEEPELSVYLLHPFDQRSTAWDIAKDASSRAKCREIANVLFPALPSHHDFFGDASQVIAATVMDALNRQVGDQWTFYDLLTALRPENIEAVLNSNPYGKEQYKTYFQNSATSSSDIIKTLANKTDLLLPAAYAWTQAKDRLSLTDWVKTQTKSIILANNDEFDDVVTEVNRILLNLLCKLLLTVKPPPARTFLYLDEVEHLGHIATLKKIGQKGADRQVHMALSLHSLDTLTTVYGKETEGILGDCGFKAFLSVENRNTAGWASDIIGTQEVVLEQKTTQSGSTTGESTRKDDTTTSKSEQKGESVTRVTKTRKLVPPYEIMGLPMPTIAQAVTGYFKAPGHGPYKGTLPLSKLVCSRDEYLDRRDVKNEKHFYALWPKDGNVCEYAPQLPEAIDPPDDSFANLDAFKFHKSGYQGEAKRPPASRSQSSQQPAQPDNGISEPEAEPDGPTIDLDDLDFGFELEDE